MTLDQTAGTFTIKNEDEVAGTYAIGMLRIDDEGEATFTDDGFELPAQASVSLDYNDWNAANEKLKVTVDAGDGSAPTEAELESD